MNLSKLESRPRRVRGLRNGVNGARLLFDYLTMVPPRMARWTAPLRSPYPAPFEKVSYAARDGTRMKAWLGRAADATRDGIVLLPGLWTSKDNTIIRARSVRILQEWGYHVFVPDKRGVGQSERVPSTPGWKEAQDVVDAVAEFRRRAPLGRVHLYGESLAASAILVAVIEEARAGRRLTDGHVVAVSPFADAADTTRLYSHPRPAQTELGRDFVLVQRFFNFLLRLQGFRGGRFDAYLREILPATRTRATGDPFGRNLTQV